MSLNQEIAQEMALTEETVASYIVNVTNSVFNTMVMLDASDDYPLKEPVTRFNCSITGMVGFVGTYSGLVSIHCPLPLAKTITASMLGLDESEVSDDGEDLNDAMGEVANMLAGSIKQLLTKGGLDIKLSIPTMISGEEYTVTMLSEQDCVIIPFYVQGDRRFLVGLALRKEEK